MEAEWIEPVFYQAKVGVKTPGLREVSHTLTLCADSGDTPAAIKKKLTGKLASRYEEAMMPVTIRVKELKKIRSDAFIYLSRCRPAGWSAG